MMKTDEEIAGLVERYVRGDMTDSEAEAFEALYFQRKDIARLVQAEQVLARASDLLGPDGGDRRVLGRLARARPLAVAAGLLLLVVAGGFLVFQGPGGHDGEPGVASGAAGEPRELVAVTRVRLSPLRSAFDARPAYRFALPTDPGRAAALDLPLPASLLADPGAELALDLARVESDGYMEQVWQRRAAVERGARSLEVLLPGGSLEPGAYRLALLRAGDAGEHSLVMEFGFEVLAE